MTTKNTQSKTRERGEIMGVVDSLELRLVFRERRDLERGIAKIPSGLRYEIDTERLSVRFEDLPSFLSAVNKIAGFS